MAGTVYSRFFWQDWAGDEQLILCSMAAQGLWMRLLCVAARSTPIGHVKVAGRKPTEQEIHEITRCPVDQIKPLTEELIRNGVCDLTREGILVSRRMVRDYRKHESSVKGGKSRQKQVSEKQDENAVSSRTLSQPPESRVQNPLARVHSQEPDSGAGKVADERRATRISTALNLDPGDWNRHRRLIEQMADFERQGFDLDRDVVPCIEQLAAEGRIAPDVRSLRYFEKPLRDFVRAREIVQAAEARLTAKFAAARPSLPQEDWERAMWHWMYDGSWATVVYGPPPTDPACEAPKRFAEIARGLRDGLLGGRPYARYEASAHGEVPIGWPEGKFWRGRLDMDSLKAFVASDGKIDARVLEEPAGNVIPLRKDAVPASQKPQDARSGLPGVG